MRFVDQTLLFLSITKSVTSSASLAPDILDDCAEHAESVRRQQVYYDISGGCGTDRVRLDDFESCVDDVFHLDDLGKVIVGKNSTNETKTNKIVFSTNRPDVTVRVYRTRQCEQLAVLSALQGLEKIVPRMYNFIPKDSKCTGHVFVLEDRVGTAWPVDKSIREISPYLTSLMKQMKILYSLGFVNGSLTPPSLRISGTEETLISGWDVAEFAIGDAYDFENFSSLIPPGLIHDAFTESIKYLGRSSCPPFDLWKDIFSETVVSTEAEIIETIRELFTPYLEKFERGIVSISKGLLPQLIPFPTILTPSLPPPFVLPDFDPSKLYWKFRGIIDQQLREDRNNAISRPYLLYDSELIRGQIYKMGRIISRRKDAVVAFTSIPDGYVLKYQSNCADLTKQTIDLQRDFGFQKYIQDHIPGMRIATRVEFLSPPIKLPMWQSSKTNFDMEKLGDNSYTKCAENPRSHLRYMLMEKAQDAVFDVMQAPYYNKFERFKLGIKLAIELISKLEKIHGLGIVHGDVHPGNVVRLPNADGSFEFGFIDFGLAFFDEEYSAPDCVEKTCESVIDASRHNHCYQTFWNLEGSRIAFRDDVLNSLMLASMLMNGNELYNFCSGLKKDTPKMIDWKKNTFIFSMKRRDIVREATPGIDAAVQDEIRDGLRAALNEARSVKTVTERPNYDAILMSLDRVNSIVSGLTVDFSKLSSQSSSVSGIDHWSEVQKFSGDLKLVVPLACPTVPPYQVELHEKGKVTFPLTCTLEATPCESISPRGAIKYRKIEAVERKLISDFPTLRFNHFTPTEDQPCILYQPENVLNLLKKTYKFKPAEFAAVLIRVIRLLEKIHEKGIVTPEINPATFCWSQGNVHTIEFCQLSNLDLFVDPTTRKQIPGRSRADDFEDLFNFSLKNLRFEGDVSEIFVILKAFLQQAKDFTLTDVPLYDTWVGELESLAEEYIDPPLTEIPYSDSFIDLKRIEGEIDWSIASTIIAEAQVQGPDVGEDDPVTCPIEGERDFEFKKFSFPAECHDQLTCISTDGFMEARRILTKPDRKFDFMELSFSLELSEHGFPTYQFFKPLFVDSKCTYSPQYIRSGGVEIRSVSFLTEGLIKQCLRVLRKLHFFGLVYQGSFGEGIMVIKNSEIALNNLRNIRAFVDPELGVHLPAMDGSRKEDLLRLASELKEISEKNSQRYFVEFFDSMIASTRELDPEAKPDYGNWISLIPEIP